MIDEAFMPFHEIVERLVAFRQELVSAEAGVRSYIYECAVELPVELDIVRDEDGALRVGSTPPLYTVDTSIRPSFHSLRLTAHLRERTDAD